MEYRKWNDRNIKTSTLGFGVMRVKTIDGEIDYQKGKKIIDYAYKHGVNYFDTAMPYTNGLNETFLGKALKEYDRSTFYIATKLSLGVIKTKEEMENIIDIQLSNLQTPYIDFYLLHSLNKERFEKLLSWNVFETLEKWKKEGKIRNIGFSFHDGYDSFKYIINYYNWDFCQIQLNYIDTDNQQGIQGYYDCVEKNIPVVVMEPIKGGCLSNFNKSVAHILTDYNKEKSLSSWALRWVGSLPNVKVILSGMNELDQVIDNIETFTNFIPLSKEELELTALVKEKLGKIAIVPCTNCKYCMPCPAGVNIPGNFRILNNFEMYQIEGSITWALNSFIEEKMDATICVKCGKCLKLCPQQINIPEELAKSIKTLDFVYNKK